MLSPQQVCENLKALDKKYDTQPGTPLHHDSRYCPICSPQREKKDF